MGIVKSIIKQLLDEAVIVFKRPLSQSAYHIRIQSDSIKSAEFTPGYFLRIALGVDNNEVTLRDMVRSYSVWQIDKIEGTVDLAIATHSNGLGANWVRKCSVGSIVYYKWKRSNFVVNTNFDSYLMVGDLSALAHLYCINRALPDTKVIKSIIYSDKITDLYSDIDDTYPFEFHELQQDSADQIVEKINEIIPVLQGTKRIYVAGDSRICIAIHKQLRNDLSIDNEEIRIKPFWNPGKKGLE